MTATSASAPSIANSLIQLISGASSGLPAPTAGSANSASPSPTAPPDDPGAAAFVTLSERAKAAVAARADSDRAAADRLQAFVEAQRANPGTGPARAQPTTGAKVQAIVAQITALADANGPQPFQAFTPTKSLSNSVTYGGFTLTLDTNASTQLYGIELSGNGVEAYSKHFGPTAGAGGGSALPPGVTISTGIADNNNEAIDAITITQNVATADSASASSSTAGSISASEVNAQSSSITFLVNYATGEISVRQSAVSVSAQSISLAAPGSTLSTLA